MTRRRRPPRPVRRPCGWSRQGVRVPVPPVVRHRAERLRDRRTQRRPGPPERRARPRRRGPARPGLGCGRRDADQGCVWEPTPLRRPRRRAGGRRSATRGRIAWGRPWPGGTHGRHARHRQGGCRQRGPGGCAERVRARREGDQSGRRSDRPSRPRPADGVCAGARGRCQRKGRATQGR